MVVVDSSVLVKWFVPEPDSTLAIALRQAHIDGRIRIAVPDLALLEVANALRYKFSAADEATVRGSVRSLTQLGVRVVASSPELVASAVGVAYASNITVYDALFVALARDMGFELVTADLDLERRTRGIHSVRLLADWGKP